MTEINDCKDFVPWTQPSYEEAGCSGCALFLIYTDSHIECQLQHGIKREKINCKAFGLVNLVIKDDD